jgi:SAM-dependent methyltransferase
MTDDFDVPANWYEDFFHEPANRFWERVVPPEAAEDDARYLHDALRLAPPAAILDLACGAGRHARALARRGFAVTGIDISEDAIARARIASAGLPTSFVQANLLALPEIGLFDGACWMGNGFAYFGRDETIALLQAVRRRMNDGARLVIDSYSSAESVFADWQEDQVHPFPGGTYETRSSYDPRTAKLNSVARLTIDGEHHTLRYAHVIRTSGETVRLFEEAGWTVESLHSGLGGEPFTIGSPRLLLAAVAT